MGNIQISMVFFLCDLELAIWRQWLREFVPLDDENNDDDGNDDDGDDKEIENLNRTNYHLVCARFQSENVSLSVMVNYGLP